MNLVEITGILNNCEPCGRVMTAIAIIKAGKKPLSELQSSTVDKAHERIIESMFEIHQLLHKG